MPSRSPHWFRPRTSLRKSRLEHHLRSRSIAVASTATTKPTASVMTTPNINPSPATMPAPVFSYAQAAKGATAVAAPPTPPTAPTPTSTQQNHAPDSTDASKANASRPSPVIKSERIESVSGEPANNNAKPEPAGRNSTETLPSSGKITLRSSAPPSTNGSGRADDDAATDQSAQRSERRPRSPSVASMATQDAEKNGKGGRKDKSVDSEPKSGESVSDKEQQKEAVKAPLVEAPIPSVNPWHRKEGVVANARLSPPSQGKSAPPAETENQAGRDGTVKPLDSTKQLAGQSESESNENGSAIKTQRRNGTDVTRGNDIGPRRNGPRGSRAEKEERLPAALSLPPVQDSSAWPTPDSATKDERRPSLEKTDASEKDSLEATPSTKKKGKAQWEKVDIPLTYKFETTIGHPSARGRGRGGARGGREGVSRGGQLSSAGSHGDKKIADGSGAAAASGADSGPPKANGDVRDRRESTVSNRPPSMPLPPRKQHTAGDVPAAQEKPRKHSVPAASVGERTKENVPASVQVRKHSCFRIKPCKV